MDIPTPLKGEYDPIYEVQFNEALRDGLALGVYNQEYTTAQINLITGMNARPILRRGTVFFDTTVGKLKVIVTSAVPGVSNAIIETITSTP